MHREVGRAKDLPAPLYTAKLLVTTLVHTIMDYTHVNKTSIGINKKTQN